MKFYGNGTVWDGANNKALCKFANGELETDDARIQDALIEKGYACDPENTDPCETCETDTPAQRCVKCELPESAKTVTENKTQKKPIKKGVKK